MATPPGWTLGWAANIRRTLAEERNLRDDIARTACAKPCHNCQWDARMQRIDETSAGYGRLFAASRGSLGQPYFAERG